MRLLTCIVILNLQSKRVVPQMHSLEDFEVFATAAL